MYKKVTPILISTSIVGVNRVDKSLREVTNVNEISLTIGIFLLTMGTFLCGILANESGGRYWGWDAKETCALIFVIIYAFTPHVMLIVGLNSKCIFHVFSVQSDPLPIPEWVYYILSNPVICVCWRSEVIA